MTVPGGDDQRDEARTVDAEKLFPLGRNRSGGLSSSRFGGARVLASRLVSSLARPNHAAELLTQGAEAGDLVRRVAIEGDRRVPRQPAVGLELERLDRSESHPLAREVHL